MNLYPEQIDRIRPGEIGFFIVYNGVSFLLPVNPDEIEFRINGKNETREIITLGDINLLKTPALVECTVNSFFPRNLTDVSEVNTENRFFTSVHYKAIIDQIFNNKDYFRLVITGLDYTYLMAIENLTWRSEAGDHENLYYTMELKQYRPYGVKLTYDGNSNGPALGAVAAPGNSIAAVPTERTNPTDTTTKSIVIGSQVVCTGTLYVDADGSKTTGTTYSRKRGIISAITKGRKYPYHFIASGSATSSETSTGWVAETAVQLG